ncbi:cephalosporin hydroxylase [Bosea psychrotolerans]|uniref:Cephalosporin hydroxylase n=1 Tax=Bosea psychrotolerans TaxID=1871628 RepID=A0A2S4LY08_9HYPH|nr:cephalosporin hydroxylase [Bosea psychrotolerans]
MLLNPVEEFEIEKRKYIEALGQDVELRQLTKAWFERASKQRYSYHFTWLGRPVIQFPQDLIAMQELIWAIKPELIIETGVAHGGSLIFSASILEMLGGVGEVVGIDIDIRAHNRKAIEEHPMSKRITLIEGNSCSADVLEQVEKHAAGKSRVLVILDSNHTKDHVARELELYHHFVMPGSYLLVFDTVIDDMPDSFSAERPWGPGNGPKVAVLEFLAKNKRFSADLSIDDKLQITVAPNGFLRCVAAP